MKLPRSFTIEFKPHDETMKDSGNAPKTQQNPQSMSRSPAKKTNTNTNRNRNAQSSGSSNATPSTTNRNEEDPTADAVEDKSPEEETDS